MGSSPRENSSRGHGVYKKKGRIKEGQSLVGRELQQSNKLVNLTADTNTSSLNHNHSL